MKKKFKNSLLLLLMLNTTFMFAQNVFQNTSSMHVAAFRLKPGEDLKIMLDNYVKEHHIKAATMITCSGSLRRAVIRYADKKDADTLTGKFEIVSLTGTLSEAGSHLHISISDGNGKTTGGHLKEGSIIYTTAEIVIGILEDLAFDRETDSTYGYKELVIKKIQEKE